MAFEFKFATLLKHRKRLEEAAQRDYLEAKAILDHCLEGIEALYISIEETRLQISLWQRRGQVDDLMQISDGERFIDGQKIRIERERIKARQLMAIVEEKQELLVEAAREFKKIDKLKEKLKAEHKKEAKKREVKRLDDLVVIRANRGERP